MHLVVPVENPDIICQLDGQLHGKRKTEIDPLDILEIGSSLVPG